MFTVGSLYKTAWRIAKAIRTELMEQTEEPLDGTVELDESYFGGKAVNMHHEKRKRLVGRGTAGKQPVFGMVERQGNAVAVTVPNVSRVTLMPHIQERVLPTATIYTDEMSSYDPLRGKGYNHDRVNHSAKVYVSGDVHTTRCPLSIFKAT